MTDEEALAREMQRAREAETLLRNPLLTEAFERLEAGYLDFWKATEARDTDARERLWQAIQIVGKVKTHLHNVVASGTLASADVRQIARLGERKKILGVI